MIPNDGYLQTHGCNLDITMQSPIGHSVANHAHSQHMFMHGVTVVVMYLLQDMKTRMDIVKPAPG